MYLNQFMKEILVVLENIRSVHNVGSIFRTTDGFGYVKKVFLCGYTPTPNDRFNRPRKDFLKTSLGAEKSVLWEKADDAFSLVKKLKKDGFFIVSVENTKKAKSFVDFKLTKKTVFVFGNEVDGVSEKILKISDEIIKIPQKGIKESLNVSVCYGIVLFSLLKK